MYRRSERFFVACGRVFQVARGGRVCYYFIFDPKGITKMTYEQAKMLLEKNGQEQVLRFWKKLSKAE